MIPPAETQTLLTLSTAHLRERTCNEWLENCPWSCFPKGEWGWFLYVNDDPGITHVDSVPNELKPILEYALSLGCSWVMFDSDGPVQDGLVTYDW